MFLKITSPEQPIYSGPVKKITIPTQGGELTILPLHQPLATVTRSGIMKITPEKITDIHKTDYIIDNGVIHIAINKGMMLVDGKSIHITTSAATNSPQHSEELLREMKKEMEEKLKGIKESGNKEDLEDALINLEQVTADLRLTKLKKVGK